MHPHPLRLLVTAYGLAGLGAGAVLASGLPWPAGLAVLWLGGPVAVVALGLTPGLSRAFVDVAHADEADRTGAFRREYTRWEEDMAAEFFQSLDHPDRKRIHGARAPDQRAG